MDVVFIMFWRYLYGSKRNNPLRKDDKLIYEFQGRIMRKRCSNERYFGEGCSVASEVAQAARFLAAERDLAWWLLQWSMVLWQPMSLQRLVEGREKEIFKRDWALKRRVLGGISKKIYEGWRGLTKVIMKD